MDSKPLVSIIIATYNVSSLIEDTLVSILNQTYTNYEILIVDAGSDFHTLSFIDKYKDHLSYFVSEPDSGIYDAWNKALLKAKGDWISFLGAGDRYLENALENYVNFLTQSPKTFDFISSIIEIIDDSGKLISIHGKEWSWPDFLKNMDCAHVGAFHSQRLFKQYGNFDTSYQIAADYELLMRARSDLSAGFLPLVTVQMLSGGISSTRQILSEVRRLKIHSGKKPVVIANLEYIKNLLKFQAKLCLRFLSIINR